MIRWFSVALGLAWYRFNKRRLQSTPDLNDWLTCLCLIQGTLETVWGKFCTPWENKPKVMRTLCENAKKISLIWEKVDGWIRRAKTPLN